MFSGLSICLLLLHIGGQVLWRDRHAVRGEIAGSDEGQERGDGLHVEQLPDVLRGDNAYPVVDQQVLLAKLKQFCAAEPVGLWRRVRFKQ